MRYRNALNFCNLNCKVSKMNTEFIAQLDSWESKFWNSQHYLDRFLKANIESPTEKIIFLKHLRISYTRKDYNEYSVSPAMKEIYWWCDTNQEIADHLNNKIQEALKEIPALIDFWEPFAAQEKEQEQAEKARHAASENRMQEIMRNLELKDANTVRVIQPMQPTASTKEPEKIQWNGTAGELIYLFELLMNKGLLPIELTHKRFAVIARHFVNNEGKPFKNTQLNVSEKQYKKEDGTGKPRRAELIENIVKEVIEKKP